MGRPSPRSVPRRLGSFSRLIVFDKRGTGISDRSIDRTSWLLEDRVNDIARLMDTVGSERAVIMGLSETGAVALLFAATTRRTRAVVAYGTFAGGGDTNPTYPWAPDPRVSGVARRAGADWGRGVLYLRTSPDQYETISTTRSGSPGWSDSR